MATKNESGSSAQSVTTTDREISATRVFDAPRDLVFKVWTDPKHVAQWWGPKGFMTTTYKMDAKPGGVWRFVMHGPDGRDYENKITFVEVVEGERLVYKHGGDKDVEPVNFEVTVTFADAGAGKTRLEMRMLFPSSAAKDYTVKTYGAVEGLAQTLDRLGEHVANKRETDDMFVLSRSFDAPRELVYKAWTEPERLSQWFGPKGFTMPTCTMDLRPGGVFHYGMRSPDGHEMWGKWTFREVVPPQRIVCVVSFSDEKGGVTRHPMSAQWPLETLSMVTFAEHEGRTIVTIRWSAINASEDERKTFASSHDGMRGGWGGTMEQLAEYLAKAS